MLQSGGQIQNRSTSAAIGYITHAFRWSPTKNQGTKSEVVDKWADWVDHPLPTASDEQTKSEVAHKRADVLQHNRRLEGTQQPRTGDKI